jgi:hypothetical protein
MAAAAPTKASIATKDAGAASQDADAMKVGEAAPAVKALSKTPPAESENEKEGNAEFTTHKATGALEIKCSDKMLDEDAKSALFCRLPTHSLACYSLFIGKSLIVVRYATEITISQGILNSVGLDLLPSLMRGALEEDRGMVLRVISPAGTAEYTSQKMGNKIIFNVAPKGRVSFTRDDAHEVIYQMIRKQEKENWCIGNDGLIAPPAYPTGWSKEDIVAIEKVQAECSAKLRAAMQE